MSQAVGIEPKGPHGPVGATRPQSTAHQWGVGTAFPSWVCAQGHSSRHPPGSSWGPAQPPEGQEGRESAPPPSCETPNGHGGLTRGGAGGRAVEGGPGSGQRGCREEVRASWAWARPSEARAHGRSVTPRSVPDPSFRLRTLPPPRAQCQLVIWSHITKETHGGQVSRPRSHLLGQEKPGRPCFFTHPFPP